MAKVDRSAYLCGTGDKGPSSNKTAWWSWYFTEAVKKGNDEPLGRIERIYLDAMMANDGMAEVAEMHDRFRAHLVERGVSPNSNTLLMLSRLITKGAACTWNGDYFFATNMAVEQVDALTARLVGERNAMVGDALVWLLPRPDAPGALETLQALRPALEVLAANLRQASPPAIGTPPPFSHLAFEAEVVAHLCRRAGGVLEKAAERHEVITFLDGPYRERFMGGA